MKPIPRPPVPSLDQGSQATADAFVVGSPVPLGIPASFIVDQLLRGRVAEQVLGGPRGLIAEYAGAEGYAYRWGQLIEVRLGRYVLWRVVPVTIWDELARRREGSPLLIEDLLTRVQPGVRPKLRRRLPRDVLLAGCRGESRRSPHALFALLLADPAAITFVRKWLAAPFLSNILPRLLTDVESDVAAVLRKLSIVDRGLRR